MISQVNFSAVELKLRATEIRNMLYENTKSKLREMFDEDITSLDAQALIFIAKEKGLNDLVVEMENDLHIELLEV